MKTQLSQDMALVSSRNRLIYFRVSEEELERIRSLAESKGARSVSDLAREAIEKLHRPPLDSDSSQSFPILLDRIHALQSTLDLMNDRIDRLALSLQSQTDGPDTLEKEMEKEMDTWAEPPMPQSTPKDGKDN